MKLTRRNKILVTVLVCVFAACKSGHKNTPPTVPDIRVLNYDADLKKTDSGWFYKGKPFSGYMVERETDGRLVYELPIMEGRENGLAKGWYNSGEKLLEREFRNGIVEGLFKQWWPNGRYRYLFNFRNGQYDGTQLIYFPDGKMRQRNNYLQGSEEGLQSTWNEAGELISNYTIRNKKLYGVIAVKSCIPNAH